MKLGLIALIVVGLLLICRGLVLGGSLFGTHNQLVQEREAIKAAWRQVDIVLQRRNDLIPNLVATVKGFAKHEQERAIDSVTKARAAMVGAQTQKEKIAANSQLTRPCQPVDGRRRKLSATSKPTRISCAFKTSFPAPKTASPWSAANITRRCGNITPTFEIFPNNIAASIWGFQRDDAYFKADAAAKQAPKVFKHVSRVAIIGSGQIMPSPTFQNYIDGQWVAGTTFENRNPADTSDVVGEFIAGTAADMADAVDAASRALPALERHARAPRAAPCSIESPTDWNASSTSWARR